MEIPNTDPIYPSVIDTKRVFIGDVEIIDQVPDYYTNYGFGSPHETHVCHLLNEKQTPPYFERALTTDDGRHRARGIADLRYEELNLKRVREATRETLETLVRYDDENFRIHTLSKKVKQEGLRSLTSDVGIVKGIVRSLDYEDAGNFYRTKGKRKPGGRFIINIEGIIPEKGKNNFFTAEYYLNEAHFLRFLRNSQIHETIREYNDNEKTKIQVTCITERIRESERDPRWRVSGFSINNVPYEKLVNTINASNSY